MTVERIGQDSATLVVDISEVNELIEMLDYTNATQALWLDRLEVLALAIDHEAKELARLEMEKKESEQGDLR